MSYPISLIYIFTCQRYLQYLRKSPNPVSFIPLFVCQKWRGSDELSAEYFADINSSYISALFHYFVPAYSEKEREEMESRLYYRHGSLFASSSSYLSPLSNCELRRSLSTLFKVKNQSKTMMSLSHVSSGSVRCEASFSSNILETSEMADINWDNLGFEMTKTDFMYVMKCYNSSERIFSKGELVPYGPLQMDPCAGVLNYGQGLFEGLKAYRKENGEILLFRPEENAIRMRSGAERLCMPCPTTEQIIDAIKQTVLANKKWVPPAGKGALYIRPLLLGSGPTLSLNPAPEFTFLVFVSPVGNYFKEGLSPINLKVENELHRAAPGGTGGVKCGGNYAPVIKAQQKAREKGFADVLYLDCVHKKYLEEVSSSNIFFVKDNIISTPVLKGTILPGITRKSIMDVARSKGYKVEERLIQVEELFEADEVFCSGTAVVISPVGSISYLDHRVEYGNKGVGMVSQQLYSAITSLQMGLAEDTMGWTIKLD